MPSKDAPKHQNITKTNGFSMFFNTSHSAPEAPPERYWAPLGRTFAPQEGPRPPPQGPQDEPKGPQGPPPSPPRSSSESPEVAQGPNRHAQEPHSGLKPSSRPPKGRQVSPKT